MRFRTHVSLVTLSNAFMRSVPEAEARRMVLRGQCERLTSGVIRLLPSESLGKMRGEWKPEIVRPPKMRRRPVHDVTKPAAGSSLPHLHRSDTGQTAAVRVVHLERYYALYQVKP